MIEVEKNGIDWLLMPMSMSRQGLTADILVDPRVEEFFRQLTDNQVLPISAYGGKDWAPVEGADPLTTYAVNEESCKNSAQFIFGYPGYPFLSDRFPGKINLSFLHLVGASKGVKLIIKSPVSGAAKREFRMKVEQGMHEFVRQYLTFGKMIIRVSSYDL